MNKKSAASLERAGDFVWRNARLIERALFAHLFVEASAPAVIAALKAYQNADGGFGNALEADVRAPSSMPVACETAMPNGRYRLLQPERGDLDRGSVIPKR
jgi:hypothetical protein